MWEDIFDLGLERGSFLTRSLLVGCPPWPDIGPAPCYPRSPPSIQLGTRGQKEAYMCHVRHYRVLHIRVTVFHTKANKWNPYRQVRVLCSARTAPLDSIISPSFLSFLIHFMATNVFQRDPFSFLNSRVQRMGDARLSYSTIQPPAIGASWRCKITRESYPFQYVFSITRPDSSLHHEVERTSGERYEAWGQSRLLKDAKKDAASGILNQLPQPGTF